MGGSAGVAALGVVLAAGVGFDLADFESGAVLSAGGGWVRVT